jgi:photosystem II stability/assembly factor-like uncharacterized protein
MPTPYQESVMTSRRSSRARRSRSASPAPLAHRGPIFAVAFAAATTVLALAAPSATAAPWRQVGPEGGSVLALARAAQAPQRVYAAAHFGGIFRSLDGGESWSVVLPRREDAGWSLVTGASGELVLASDRTAILRSTDGGDTWTAAFETVLSIHDLALAPSDPDVAYAVGHRIWRSGDGGTTWTTVDDGIPTFGPYVFGAVAVHPTDPGTVWVINGEGVWRTTDGGGTWQQVLATGHLRDVAADPHAPGTVYVGGPGQFRVSRDGGQSWSLIEHQEADTIVPDADTPGAVYIVHSAYTGSFIGGHDWLLWRSSDGGESFDHLHTFLGRASDVAPPVGGEPLLVAQDWVGVEASDDGGGTWRAASRGLRATGVSAFDLAPRQPSTVHAGILDPVQWVRSPDGGVHWPAARYAGASGGASRVVAHPGDPDRAFLLFPEGIADTQGSGVLDVRRVDFGTHTALAVDPADARRLYVVTHETVPTCEFIPDCPVIDRWRLYASGDGGETWRELPVPGAPDRPLFDVAVDPLDSRVLWLAGADAGGAGAVLRGDDRGESWTVLGAGLPSPLERLVVESGSITRRLWGISSEPAANVYRSEDAGATWLAAAEGLPNGAEASALDSVPHGDVAGPLFGCGDEESGPALGVVLLGTMDDGVFYRRCDRWLSVGEGLPRLPVVDVDAVPGQPVVFASLLGAGLWRTGVAEGCDDEVPELLCLRGGRFRAEVDWRTARGGGGPGMESGGVSDGGGGAWGWFWFFDPDNAELALKVLDGRPVNDHWWVFFASMTDVAFELTVTDLDDGAFRVYRNPPATLASRGDTAAFPAGGGPTARWPASRVPAGDAAPTAAPATTASCGGGPGALCLQEGRFRVEAEWQTPQGGSGDAAGVPLADDSGYLWFFRPGNPELFVKVLDGRPVNGHWWVFYGSLSNVGFTITVTDNVTHETAVFHNPAGTLASAAHTAAF